jgi:hypothetical protein
MSFLHNASKVEEKEMFELESLHFYNTIYFTEFKMYSNDIDCRSNRQPECITSFGHTLAPLKPKQSRIRMVHCLRRNKSR